MMGSWLVCRRAWFAGTLVVLAVLAAPRMAAAATIEFLSGRTLECKVLSKDDKTVTVEVQVEGRPVKRVLQLSTIHAVTINDKRYVINAKPAGLPPSGAPAEPAPKPFTGEPGAGGGKPRRTKAEVDALINAEGRTPPPWFESTPLNYPQSLDLSWPQKPPGGWNNQVNVGQYVWDIVNPNPGKWREGVRLMHHLLTLHKDSPEVRTRVMNELGRMYFSLHEDYARAAFWWRQAGLEQNRTLFPGSTIHLAECYHRLGNDSMAIALLRSGPVSIGAIKLWADLGDLPAALQIAERYAPTAPDMGYLAAGDACRTAGRLPQAVAYYDKVLALAATGQAKGRIERNQKRAQANREAIRLFQLSDVKQAPDGTYMAESLGYEGMVKVEVVVAGGRLESVRVVDHREKQFYSALTDTPAKLIARQGVQGVDATSGATITSEAIINSTAKALAGASGK